MVEFVGVVVVEFDGSGVIVVFAVVIGVPVEFVGIAVAESDGGIVTVVFVAI